MNELRDDLISGLSTTRKVPKKVMECWSRKVACREIIKSAVVDGYIYTGLGWAISRTGLLLCCAPQDVSLCHYY